MKRNRLLFYYCITAVIVIGDNHETNVVGKVLTTGDAIPLQGANVTFVNAYNEYGSTTDEMGVYAISNISPGKYSITVSFIGFEDYKENILIEAGKLYNIDAELVIQPIVMSRLEIISDSSVPYKKLPGSATVLDMETIKLVNPIGTQEMLEYIPGVNGYADDGIGNSRISIGIRGLNPRRSSRVLILEDGIPIQPALYVYPNMYYNPPADRIDRIEVIKGSGAIKYGPQTMGGVINYFTRRPRNEFGGMMRITAGENGYVSAFIETGGWGNTKLKPEVQILLKKGDGYRDNNSFEQINGTLKLNYASSLNKNLYIKTNFNYENSNATYTGLTQWSFNNNPKFNPKKDDNFKVFRSAIDLIQTERINSKISQITTAYVSFFDRRWWRENDIFILSSDLDDQNPTPQPYYSSGNLVRTGNGKDNFGILRTFHVLGFEKSYLLKHKFFGFNSTAEAGVRLYWERFIDDKKSGSSTDSRDGIYYIPATTEDESPEIVGQSHHYETTALAAFISESIEMGSLTLRPGMRFEVFEQERVDRLAGSIYQDKTIFVALPGIGFIKSFARMSVFGGVHRGFTPPSSGALKIVNFGMDVEDNGLDLEAEKSWNKEIGIRGELSIIDYELAGYHININNLVAAGRGTAFKNLGKVVTQGLEFRALINLSSQISLFPNIHISYSFLDTEVIDGIIVSNVSGTYGSEVSIKGKELPYSPKNTLTIGLESRLINDLSVRMDYRFVSKVYTDYENITATDNLGVTGPVPSYNLLNISANYHFTDRLQMSLSGKNIADNIYIGSRLHSNPGQKNANISSGIIPGSRRQINIGVNYIF